MWMGKVGGRLNGMGVEEGMIGRENWFVWEGR